MWAHNGSPVGADEVLHAPLQPREVVSVLRSCVHVLCGVTVWPAAQSHKKRREARTHYGRFFEFFCFAPGLARKAFAIEGNPTTHSFDSFRVNILISSTI